MMYCVHCGAGDKTDKDWQMYPGICGDCRQTVSRRDQAITCIQERSRLGQLTAEAIEMAYSQGGVLYEPQDEGEIQSISFDKDGLTFYRKEERWIRSSRCEMR